MVSKTGRASESACRPAWALVLGLLALTVWPIADRYGRLDLSGDTRGRLIIDTTFEALEPEAVVVSWWSYSTPLWYGQHVEGRRPDVTVIDDRPEWAEPGKHPSACRAVCAPYEEAGRHIEFGARSWVAVMTHGHAHDETVLRQCLGRPLRYLGMIGSRNKVKACFDRLLADGFDRAGLARVFAPIGFATGSIVYLDGGGSLV